MCASCTSETKTPAIPAGVLGDGAKALQSHRYSQFIVAPIRHRPGNPHRAFIDFTGDMRPHHRACVYRTSDSTASRDSLSTPLQRPPDDHDQQQQQPQRHADAEVGIGFIVGHCLRMSDADLPLRIASIVSSCRFCVLSPTPFRHASKPKINVSGNEVQAKNVKPKPLPMAAPAVRAALASDALKLLEPATGVDTTLEKADPVAVTP